MLVAAACSSYLTSGDLFCRAVSEFIDVCGPLFGEVKHAVCCLWFFFRALPLVRSVLFAALLRHDDFFHAHGGFWRLSVCAVLARSCAVLARSCAVLARSLPDHFFRAVQQNSASDVNPFRSYDAWFGVPLVLKVCCSSSRASVTHPIPSLVEPALRVEPV